MLIAHLPAGYLLGSAARQRSAAPGIMIVALIGSVLPDFDMVYFFLTGGKVHHHDYVSHWPLFWLGFAATAPLSDQSTGAGLASHGRRLFRSRRASYGYGYRRCADALARAIRLVEIRADDGA